jgi:adenylate cyclase
MAEERAQRRLAAVLAADVVGYSRLMERDENGTLAALKARRKQVLEPLVARHHGRVFKVAGDGALVEFASAVDAVECAVELQRGMAEANSGAPEDRHIVLRIGVNLGDVMVEGGDRYGDSVNIAARLEGIAKPGDVLVSGAAFDHVKNKVKLDFEDLGTQTLKNIAEPVRVYRVTGTPPVSARTLRPATDKPSIAVLPFTNMSGDPEQQYLSDGITEDIITALARFKSLTVLARYATFHRARTAGSAVDAGRDLGVTHVVEGSVRKVGATIRITAQLIDAGTGSHVWAERYDRDSADIFAVQDEVVAAIVAALEGRMVTAAAASARLRPTTSWSAYDFLLQGRELCNYYREPEAVAYFTRSLAIDPNYTQAHAWHALALTISFSFNADPVTLELARKAAERALSLDNNDATAHWANAMVLLWSKEHKRSGSHFERAIALNPIDPQIQGDRANWLRYSGRLEESLDAINELLSRDPFAPAWFWAIRGGALFHEKISRSARFSQQFARQEPA